MPAPRGSCLTAQMHRGYKCSFMSQGRASHHVSAKELCVHISDIHAHVHPQPPAARGSDTHTKWGMRSIGSSGVCHISPGQLWHFSWPRPVWSCAHVSLCWLFSFLVRDQITFQLCILGLGVCSSGVGSDPLWKEGCSWMLWQLHHLDTNPAVVL